MQNCSRNQTKSNQSAAVTAPTKRKFVQFSAGAWVIASGLLRYVFVAAGWIWPWMERPLEPSRRRQTVCVIQIVALILVVSPVVMRPASAIIAAAALAVLAGSFFVDVCWLASRAGLKARTT